MNKEALYYFVEDNLVKCTLCPHRCSIKEGHRGLCNVREAIRDSDNILRLYSINYGEITSISLDPIEKKPLYHFQPNSQILSIGSFGCNFKCSFCQNYNISQYKPESKFVSSQDMADMSLHMDENIGIAFTYNEPSIWYEYVLEVSKLIKKNNPNHKVVLVTNGYISDEPLKELLPYVDALNVDLKGGEEYYKKLCFGSLKEVKSTIKIANEKKCHIEVTTLLVPNENTDDKTLNNIVEFLGELNKDIPLHISRYFPRYKMNKDSTSLEDMRKAYIISKSHLNNVYLGNLSKEEYEFCIR